MHEVRRYEAQHRGGVPRLCTEENWPSLPDDPARAVRDLTAPGVTTVVAMADERVIGFAQTLSDGEIQSFLAQLVVEAGCRGEGTCRLLVTEALRLAGGERIDLLCEDDAADFYEAFHFPEPGFGRYPFYRPDGAP